MYSAADEQENCIGKQAQAANNKLFAFKFYFHIIFELLKIERLPHNLISSSHTVFYVCKTHYSRQTGAHMLEYLFAGLNLTSCWGSQAKPSRQNIIQKSNKQFPGCNRKMFELVEMARNVHRSFVMLVGMVWFCQCCYYVACVLLLGFASGWPGRRPSPKRFCI